MPDLGTSQKLVLAFVTLILGVVLVGTLASNALDVTALSSVADESHSLTACYANDPGFTVNESLAACNVTVTNAPSSWVSGEGLTISAVTVENGTGVALTLNTDYQLFATTGIVRFLNTTNTDAFTANTTFVSYSYYPLDYLNQGWGRSTLNLVAGFFAIALLLIAVGLFFSVAKDYNIV